VSIVCSYHGSLTTPPCTEGVEWLVSRAAIPISVKDLKRVKKIVRFNARPTQNRPGGKNVLVEVAEELGKNNTHGGGGMST